LRYLEFGIGNAEDGIQELRNLKFGIGNGEYGMQGFR
jgi:hypothetical protein